MKIDGAWGGGRDTAYKDMPQHARGRGGPPIGGNQGYVDGSVRWVKFSKMYYLHTWNTDGSRIAYFYQDDLGACDTPMIRSILAAKP